MNMLRHFGSTMALLVLAALSGCASNPACDDGTGNFDVVTICPGVSRSCAMTPCTIYYQMPQGSGKYRVTANGIVLGEFAAGEKVKLGPIWQSTYFDLPGADVPRAYVFAGTDL